MADGVTDPGVFVYGWSKKAMTTSAAEATKSGPMITSTCPHAGFELSA